MDAQDFAYWLQGFFEITEETPVLTKKQVQMVKNHLNLVFEKVSDKELVSPDLALDIEKKFPSSSSPKVFC